MSRPASQVWRRWAVGTLDMLLDRFEGADSEILALQNKLRVGEIRVKASGKAPGERSPQKKKPRA